MTCGSPNGGSETPTAASLSSAMPTTPWWASSGGVPMQSGFLDELRQRLQKFGLELHPHKTRIIEFGRFAERNRKAQRRGKPETFAFLGFTHICGTSRSGGYLILRPHYSTAAAGQASAGQKDDTADDAPADSGAGALPEAGVERLLQLVRRPHQQPGDQLVLLQCRLVLASCAPAAGPDQPADMGTDEAPDRSMAAARAPSASAARLAVQRYHPRWEPGAVVPLAGFCAGRGEQSSSMPPAVVKSPSSSQRTLASRVALRAFCAGSTVFRFHP